MYKKVRKIPVSYKQSDKTVICVYSLSIELMGESMQQIENKSVLYFSNDHKLYIEQVMEKFNKVGKKQER
jgi:hypothetical protein